MIPIYKWSIQLKKIFIISYKNKYKVFYDSGTVSIGAIIEWPEVYKLLEDNYDEIVINIVNSVKTTTETQTATKTFPNIISEIVSLVKMPIENFIPQIIRVRTLIIAYTITAYQTNELLCLIDCNRIFEVVFNKNNDVDEIIEKIGLFDNKNYDPLYMCRLFDSIYVNLNYVIFGKLLYGNFISGVVIKRPNICCD